MTRPLREIEPTKTSCLKLYSSSTIDCLERLEGGDEVSSRIFGKSSRCGKYSWLARGSALEVIRILGSVDVNNPPSFFLDT